MAKVLNEVHNLLQLWASKPEGPAAPLVFRAERWIVEALILLKITGCMFGGATLSKGWDSGRGGLALPGAWTKHLEKG